MLRGLFYAWLESSSRRASQRVVQEHPPLRRQFEHRQYCLDRFRRAERTHTLTA